MMSWFFFFFFQAEDGIRDLTVTGVQTCALPISFDSALDRACDTLVAAGEFTADNAERLRQFLRRDLLHRDHPAMTFRTGDITTAGTITCEGCGWTIQTMRTTLLPMCPQCAETTYRKTG